MSFREAAAETVTREKIRMGEYPYFCIYILAERSLSVVSHVMTLLLDCLDALVSLSPALVCVCVCVCVWIWGLVRINRVGSVRKWSVIMEASESKHLHQGRAGSEEPPHNAGIYPQIRRLSAHLNTGSTEDRHTLLTSYHTQHTHTHTHTVYVNALQVRPKTK